MIITKGQRFPITQLSSNPNLQIGLKILGIAEPVDFALFWVRCTTKTVKRCLHDIF